jgi:hypothetical protein
MSTADDKKLEILKEAGLLNYDIALLMQLLSRAWEEGFDAGERDAIVHYAGSGSWDDDCLSNPYEEPLPEDTVD